MPCILLVTVHKYQPETNSEKGALDHCALGENSVLYKL